MRFLGKLFAVLFTLGVVGAIAGVFFLVGVINFYSRDLPDLKELEAYAPAIVTRVHAGDGRLLAEFASERRIFVPVGEIPPLVKQAFLSAEDKKFYSHGGVDYVAVTRAMLKNAASLGSGRRPVGASTITQQVAKNFLLSNEVSYARKIREAILAYRIEKAFNKDQILELYLNEIFLGNRSYGVGAAALNYFNKSLSELTPAEAAYLAALPKAPNNYHPIRHRAAATDRRDWVLGRMLEDGYLEDDQFDAAIAQPLVAISRDSAGLVKAPYFAEEVRRELLSKYGGDSLYKGGLSIRTSINPTYQRIAEQALRDGLMNYDRRRRGWHGPIARLDNLIRWEQDLAVRDLPDGMLDNWQLAVVTLVGNTVQLGLNGGTRGTLNGDDVTWANAGSAKLRKGDIVMVEKAEKGPLYHLRQVPQVQGAILVMDAHTGRVLAMQGGWQFDKSEFNRATQARRQPGSAFKPFVYLTALEAGFSPASLVLDAPFEIMDRPGHYWRPENYTEDYLGATTLRVGVEKSRNLMTVRLAQHIGMDKVATTASRFGIEDGMAPRLSYALGAGETTLLRLSTAYAILVNGGRRVTPTFIDRIQDRRGQTMFKQDTRPCPACGPKIRWENQPTPDISLAGEQVVDPRIAYQMVSIMEGVVQRGTATRLRSLNRPIAGKTGTTNDSRDVWFMGFTPDIVTGVYIGYDTPKPLGDKETGGSVAAPVFSAFMGQALADVPATPFRIPAGIRLIPVDPATGTRTSPTSPRMVWEAFMPGQSPETRGQVIADGQVTSGWAQPAGPSDIAPGTVVPAQPVPVDTYQQQQWQQNPDMAWPGPPPADQETIPAPSPVPDRENEPAPITGTGGLF
ncbi:MAG: PBP1A family penicillin-binding protein [Pseudomonadota bacterium]